jgi:hypothetical protein
LACALTGVLASMIHRVVLKKTALQLQIPFHYTGEKGAFIKK